MLVFVVVIVVIMVAVVMTVIVVVVVMIMIMALVVAAPVRMIMRHRCSSSGSRRSRPRDVVARRLPASPTSATGQAGPNIVAVSRRVAQNFASRH